MTETVATRPRHSGRIVVRCSDGSTIDSEFETEAEVASFIGRVVMIERHDTGEIELTPVAARAAREAIVRVITKEPRECSDSEITAFERLVLTGEEVEKIGLVGRIKRANMLAFAFVSGVLAGVAALKQPTVNYKTSVFMKSATDFPSTAFALEIGWIYVSEVHRGKGLSGRLLRALLKQSENSPVFATSRTNNTPMHGALGRAGFIPTGKAFLSSRRNLELRLFVRGVAQPIGAPDAPQAARG